MPVVDYESKGSSPRHCRAHGPPAAEMDGLCERSIERAWVKLHTGRKTRNPKARRGKRRIESSVQKSGDSKPVFVSGRPFQGSLANVVSW